MPEAHWEQVGWIPTSCLGLFGVLLFFVHTCLVLMYSMERSNLTGSRLFTNFHIRRIFRIYPLSLLTVASALALRLTSEVNGIHGLSVAPLGGKREIIANFLLIQNLAQVKSIVDVLWSLPYELQMYLLLPFLCLWVRGKQRFWTLMALWMLSVAGALVQPRIPWLAMLSILIFVPHFLAGVVAYSLPHVPRIKSYLWPVFIFPGNHLHDPPYVRAGLGVVSRTRTWDPPLCRNHDAVACYRQQPRRDLHVWDIPFASVQHLDRVRCPCGAVALA